jgi:hypothetical protein
LRFLLCSDTPGANVSDADGFRKQAEDARQMASRSVKQEDKAFWLRLAEDWITLAQEADKHADRQGSSKSK